MRVGAIVCMLCSCALVLGALTATADACPPRLDKTAEADGMNNDASVVVAIVLVATALGSFVVIAGPAVDARRSLHRRRRRHRPTTTLDARLVEMLARAWRARALVTAILAVVASFAVAASIDEPAPGLLLLVGPLVLFVRAVATACRAQLVLGRLRDPRVSLRYDGSRFIFVLADQALVGWVTAWPSTLEREIARNLPIATIH